jgi:hypothetical protein
VRCYGKHVEEHNGNLMNLMGTHWELKGNIVGTDWEPGENDKKKILSPLPQKSKIHTREKFTHKRN